MVFQKKRRTEEILDNLKLSDQRNTYAQHYLEYEKTVTNSKALVHSPEMLF